MLCYVRDRVRDRGGEILWERPAFVVSRTVRLPTARIREYGGEGLSPQIFDCLLCFGSHNAISPELKIRLFMYYS